LTILIFRNFSFLWRHLFVFLYTSRT
jgi:hypothetical protein